MAPEREPDTRVHGLLIDYGGVLTTPVSVSMTSWAAADGVDYEGFRAVLAEWFGSSYGDVSEAGWETTNPVHEVERGEITIADFERKLAARLRTPAGGPVSPDGLIQRMFAGFEHEPAMYDMLRRVKAAGLRTGLLSNSWGDSYSRDGWDTLFDAVVISGEIGMRKPEERIYRYAVDAIGLPPHACVFVDDIGANVRAAQALGMVAVHHESPEETVPQLEAALGIPLR